AAGGVQRDGVVAAAVAVVDRVAGVDRQGATAGVAAVVALAQAGDAVAGLHAADGRAGAGAGGAVVGLAVRHRVDVQGPGGDVGRGAGRGVEGIVARVGARDADAAD